jgi:hypothetical protein
MSSNSIHETSMCVSHKFFLVPVSLMCDVNKRMAFCSSNEVFIDSSEIV